MESSQLARSFEIFDESAYIRRDDLAQMNVAHEEDMFMERLVLPPPPPPSPSEGGFFFFLTDAQKKNSIYFILLFQREPPHNHHHCPKTSGI